MALLYDLFQCLKTEGNYHKNVENVKVEGDIWACADSDIIITNKKHLVQWVNGTDRQRFSLKNVFFYFFCFRAHVLQVVLPIEYDQLLQSLDDSLACKNKNSLSEGGITQPIIA